jgi:hypothetical protein
MKEEIIMADKRGGLAFKVAKNTGKVETAVDYNLVLDGYNTVTLHVTVLAAPTA